MRTLTNSFARDEQGASAVEYGLLIAGIAAIVVTAIFLFGGFVKNTFSNNCNTVSSTITHKTC